MAFPMRGSGESTQRASQPTGRPAAPGGGANGEPNPAAASGPSPIHQAHATIHHHLKAAHALVKVNPGKAQQHINAAGIAATAMHGQACPDCGPGADTDEAQGGGDPGPGTMNGSGGGYGGEQTP